MKKTIKIALYIFFSIYCLALIKFLLLDGRVHTEDTIGFYFGQSNLIPFKSIWDYIEKLTADRINVDIVIKNVVGNLIVLFPMGCFLPCMFKSMRKYKNTLAVCFGVILIVELLQPLLRVGFLDIDDFIFNLSGASLAYLFVHIPFLNKFLKKTYIYNESELWLPKSTSDNSKSEVFFYLQLP